MLFLNSFGDHSFLSKATKRILGKLIPILENIKMDGKGDNAKNEGIEGEKDGTMDMTKTKRKPSKATKKKLLAVKPPQPAGAEFDWPKKNYFEVTCVAAENSGSGQRMVICFMSSVAYLVKFVCNLVSETWC